MFGNFVTARTIAYPMRWVNEILPPRVRLRWLLMTTRLSINSFAGMARTLVAVGTSSDADMFLTTAAAAPRNTRTSSPSLRRAAAAAFGLAGVSKGAFCSVEAALLIGRVLAGG